MKPEYAVTDLNLNNSEMVINNKYKISMNLRSVYMAYNMLATFAVTRLVGLKDDKIVDSLNNYIMKNDRVQKFELEGKHAMLLTSKHENSISYNQSLLYLTRENNPCTVVIIVDAVSRKYFTSETSWLWDIDFELLKHDCVKKVVLAGKYVHDLVTRFEYSGIDMKKVKATEDLDEMMDEVKENAVGQIYVVTCFSDRMKFMSRR
jgi:UDP-N-acetylmuramyl tripeptide synthase